MQAMTIRRAAMLGGLMTGFVAARMAGACGGGGPAPDECTAVDDPPVEEPSTACAEPPATGCKRFYLPLLGNPSMNPELAARYRAAFGLAACYVPADANAPFNCWYKEEQMGPGLKGCTDAQKIAEIYGAAKYEDHPKTCEQVPGTEDFSLQVGPDVANKIFIKLGDPPLESSLIDVDAGAPLEVNGPYRNLPQLTTIKIGGEFDCKTGIPGPDGGTLDQREWILQVNRNANGGKIRSDLAGFTYTCKVCGKSTKCTEPEFLNEPPTKPGVYDPKAARVHHIVRRADLRGCAWGSNANGNAAVISAQLNAHFHNKYPLKDEVEQINKVPPYTYTP